MRRSSAQHSSKRSKDVLSRPRLLKRIGDDRARRYLRDLRIMTTRVLDPIDIAAHTREP